ncbi:MULTISPECIES: hypothetical protein [Fusobacterium]|uniref:hypothetical protein n=1 Tax=Fusobacterium TaxID=848 RepID=UPI001F3C09E0|nr:MULTISPECIES: hypothetical protein [Fusobacterium]MCF2612566.1 hypothetical protein [Fusobacterium perfoetens]MDY2980457.1 hypothetical protein [Fusobacterium sp.]
MNQTILTLLQSIEKNFEISDYGKECCIICGTNKNITKEHLLPKWVFENDVKKSFFISPEDTLYSYRLSYLPCCKTCNSSVLGNFEHHIREILKKENKNFTISEKEDIIFWIKYLDFKFKIFGVEKACHRNTKSKSNIGLWDKPKNNPKNFFYDLFDLPATTNSLIISEPKQKNFDFFYWKDHYFSITLPQCNVSIIYFFTNKIENIEEFCNIF